MKDCMLLPAELIVDGTKSSDAHQPVKH